MLKIVPTAAFTSMLEEPSSGSNSTAYFPADDSGGTGMMSLSSSEPITHTRPVCFSEFLMVSLARTSIFCCSSPCTFWAPCLPRMLTRPARRMAAAMILAARAMSYSRFDSSPVASG